MIRVPRWFGRSLAAALLVGGLGIAGAGLGAAGVDAPLADAVQRGDNAVVVSLLEEQADVNAAQDDGATALHWAAYLDDADTTALLIGAGADVNLPNNYGVTSLGLASRNGNATVIQQLLEAGADPNDPLQAVNAGETPLMLAARSGSPKAVTVLLIAGADINATESWNGQSALMWAAAEGHVLVVRALIERGADIHVRSNSGSTALLFAARKGSIHAVRALVGAGADVNAERPDGASALLVAVINGHEDLVEFLLDVGADPNVEGGSTRLTVQGVRAQPMPLDIRKLGYTERDSETVTRGNIFGRPLQAADVEVMRLLLDHGADPTINTDDNITPLMAAAGISWASNQDRASEAQVLEAVTLLVDELDANVNDVSDVGETAMHAAAYRGANSVVQYLFDRGATLDVVAKDGRTPLRVADGVEYGNSFAAHPHTAELLRALGAQDIECPAPCAAEIPLGALQ